MVSFSGIACATSSTSYSSNSWEKTDHPYKGQIAYTEDSKTTYKSSVYCSIITMNTVGKVMSYTSSIILVKCVETIVETTWDPHNGKVIKRNSRVYFMKLYR
jgi:hypothetical protein